MRALLQAAARNGGHSSAGGGCLLSTHQGAHCIEQAVQRHGTDSTTDSNSIDSLPLGSRRVAERHRAAAVAESAASGGCGRGTSAADSQSPRWKDDGSRKRTLRDQESHLPYAAAAASKRGPRPAGKRATPPAANDFPPADFKRASQDDREQGASEAQPPAAPRMDPPVMRMRRRCR